MCHLTGVPSCKVYPSAGPFQHLLDLKGGCENTGDASFGFLVSAPPPPPPPVTPQSRPCRAVAERTGPHAKLRILATSVLAPVGRSLRHPAMF
jgi:hypothetical protein